MLIRDWMDGDIPTIDAGAALADAKSLMRVCRVKMLPVLKHGQLVGIVTDRDLKRAAPSDATSLDVREIRFLESRILMSEIMARKPICVRPDNTVEQAAMLFIEKGISSAPVLDKEGRLLGVISQEDIFRALVALTGAWHKGLQFGLAVKDLPGAIKQVEDVLRQHGGRLISILSTVERAPLQGRQVYVRIRPLDPDRMRPLIEDLRRVAKILYVFDQSNGSTMMGEEDYMQVVQVA